MIISYFARVFQSESLIPHFFICKYFRVLRVHLLYKRTLKKLCNHNAIITPYKIKSNLKSYLYPICIQDSPVVSKCNMLFSCKYKSLKSIKAFFCCLKQDQMNCTHWAVRSFALQDALYFGLDQLLPGVLTRFSFPGSFCKLVVRC